jgi:hypothetical protein
MSTEGGHTTYDNREHDADRSANSLRRFEPPYVMSGRELVTGLLLSFCIGFGIATLCFLLFH